MNITYNNFKKLPWLHFDRSGLRILLHTSNSKLISYIDSRNMKYTLNDLYELSRDELFSIIQNEMQDAFIITTFDGMTLIDITLDLNDQDYNDYLVLGYYATENTLILMGEN